MRIKRVGVTLLVLGLVACDVPAPPPKTATRLPREVCDQAARGIEKLKESGADQVKPGEVTMAEQAWLELPPGQRDQLAKLVGIDAACRADEPSLEQTIVVRNEYGRVMTERVITTSTDLSDLLDP